MGLVRGVAKTAVVAGTATHVSNNVSRRQKSRWDDKEAAEQYEAQQQAPAPAPAPEPAPAQPAPAPQQTPPVDDTTAQLKQLADLKDQGIITDEEFAAKKKQILEI